MKYTQSNRILETLKILSQGQKICVKTLALQYDESQRSIQRDIKILKDFLKDSLIDCERGCYQLLSTSHFSQLIQQDKSSKDLRSFFEFMMLVDTNLLNLLEGNEFSFIKQIKKDTNTIYKIFDNPIEALKNVEFFDQMKEAVKNRRYCDIIYHETSTKELNNIQPQKILYANNNWYLAAMTENYKMNNGFKLFRINYIESFTIKPNTFHTNIQVQSHIQQMQSLFEDYDKPQYKVTLLADEKISRFFKVKKYLRSQTEIENEDSTLTLTFMINNDMELIPLIKHWIPHLKVISPAKLKDKIKEELKTYLYDI